MTSKEALESVKHFISCNHPQESVYLCDTPEYKKIERDLEALEIIKNKQVDTFWLNKCDTYAAYNSWMGMQRMLTEDEFNLLKERLK